ncbi:MAG: MerC domain-containing protein [Pseudomonadota bacterium]
MLQIKRHLKTDSIGMVLSFVCLAHCVLLGGAVAVGLFGHHAAVDSAFSNPLFSTNDLAHKLLLLFVVPVSGLALAGGWLRHKRNDIALIGISGIALLAMAAFVAHDHLGHTTDTLMTIVGSLLLAYAHWRNRACGCTNANAETPRPA